MDSPVRQYLKQKDYLRHKLFRKLKRRRAAERQQEIDAPIREMKRRVKLKRYNRGKDDEYYYQTQNTETGDVYNVHPSAIGAHNLEVTLPEVKITAPRKHEYRSAFDGNQEYLGDLVSFAPVVGDAYDAYNAIRLAAGGDYTNAGIMAAGALLPGATDKLLKKASPVVRDLLLHPLDVAKAKYAGNYAFTKRGREKLASKWTLLLLPIAAHVEQRSNDLELAQRQLRFADHNYNLPNVVTNAPTIDTEYVYTPEWSSKYDAVNKEIGGYFDETGKWVNGGRARVEIPMFRENSYLLNSRIDPSGGVWNLNQDLVDLVAHEYTHSLLRDKLFSPWLSLSEPRKIGPNLRGYFKSDFSNLPNDKDNPFINIERRNNILNNREAESLMLGRNDIDLSDIIQSEGVDPVGVWNSLADEAVAELRGMRIAKRDMNYIYDHMYKEFGMAPDLVDLAIKMGYNKGKDPGIHINPKNRGKFNALKKRTGKTTELLTHSKNPLTRKRAIFAQNARKWHHK